MSLAFPVLLVGPVRLVVQSGLVVLVIPAVRLGLAVRLDQSDQVNRAHLANLKVRLVRVVLKITVHILLLPLKTQWYQAVGIAWRNVTNHYFLWVRSVLLVLVILVGLVLPAVHSLREVRWVLLVPWVPVVPVCLALLAHRPCLALRADLFHLVIHALLVDLVVLVVPLVLAILAHPLNLVHLVIPASPALPVILAVRSVLARLVVPAVPADLKVPWAQLHPAHQAFQLLPVIQTRLLALVHLAGRADLEGQFRPVCRVFLADRPDPLVQAGRSLLAVRGNQMVQLGLKINNLRYLSDCIAIYSVVMDSAIHQ